MKNYTKGAKRRVKQAKQEDPFALEGIERRKKQGRARMAEIAVENVDGNLKARAKMLGQNPGKEEVRRAMRDPHLGDDAGRAIYIATCAGDERRKLNSLLFEWRKSHARFLGNVINRSLWTGKDSIPHVPEPMETRDDTDYDLRTPAQKAEAAKAAWRLFCEELDILSEAQLRICHRGVWDIEPVGFVRLHNGKPHLTYDGAVFVQALRAIARRAT